MKIFETLYARDSSGRINEWLIKAKQIVPIFHVNMGGPPPWSEIIISEGLIDGIKTETTRSVHKGKNLGKLNATTHYEQACSQAQSRWERKKKQGYKSIDDLGIELLSWLNKEELIYILENHLPKNRTDTNNLSKPMKAQKYFKESDGSVRISFPCYGQPKLNGFRVIARWEVVKKGEGLFVEEIEKVVFRSKEGLRYEILEHIEKEFTKEMFFIKRIIRDEFKEIETSSQIAFDGEMYIHGEILSEISSAVRKRNLKTEKLKFCIFDVAIENMSQKNRIILINRFKDSKFSFIEIVPTRVIATNEEAQNLTDSWIKEGYEGGIFRDRKAEYQFGKRPQTMVKLKRSEDKEFQIIDVIGGDNTPDVGVFVCKAENGVEFCVTPEGSIEKKREYLTNKTDCIGKMLTVRFFERTKDNKPNHAVGIAIRDYE